MGEFLTNGPNRMSMEQARTTLSEVVTNVGTSAEELIIRFPIPRITQAIEFSAGYTIRAFMHEYFTVYGAESELGSTVLHLPERYQLYTRNGVIYREASPYERSRDRWPQTEDIWFRYWRNILDQAIYLTTPQ